MKVLIIEDDFTLADSISDVLKDENFDVHVENDGIDGELEAQSGIYDLILLDVLLPNKNGFEILETLRESIETPIIMLTAKSEMDDKLKGLENGAVDYITKPFNIRELIARVKISLKRDKDITNVNILEFGDLKLDLDNSTLTCNGEEITITIKEKEILENLILNKNKITTREELAEKIWGYDSNAEYNNVEVYISFLRKKMRLLNSTTSINYVRKKGYKLGIEND